MPFAEAKLHLNDLGLTRGFGVFDYFKTYNHVPFKISEHIQRLQRSAQGLDITLPLKEEEIVEVVDELFFLRKNKEAEMGVRLLLTAGYSEDSMN